MTQRTPMTRDARLAQAKANALAQLKTDRQRLARLEAQQRALARKARDKRRYQTGTLVESAGLAGLDDATLAGLLRLLTPLAETPNPVAVLEALLREADGHAQASIHGMAHAAHGVSPAC